MAKAILVMDMPSSCIDCPLHYYDEPKLWCGLNEKEMETEDIETYKPTWCPLRECPQKKRIISEPSFDGRIRVMGYNACIDEILGGGE
jgi:hypothetical protein